MNLVIPLVDETIVIDDASSDSTAVLAKEHGAIVFTQPENRGYINAIKRGFMEVDGDIVVTIDADGEFSPDDITRLIKPIIDGSADMVQGKRNLIARPSERVLTWFVQKKANVGDSGTGLRAIRTGIAKTLKINKTRNIAWFHFKQFFYLLPWLLK